MNVNVNRKVGSYQVGWEHEKLLLTSYAGNMLPYSLAQVFARARTIKRRTIIITVSKELRRAYVSPLVVSDTLLPVIMGHLAGLKEFENVLDSHVIFHLPQFPHDVHGVLFARRLLHGGILLLLSARMLFPRTGERC